MFDASTKILSVGRATGGCFAFRMKSGDVPSPAEFQFFVKDEPSLTVTAQADPANPANLFFVFSADYVASLGSKAKNFTIIHSKDGRRRTYLSGQIIAEGFAV